MEYFSIMDKKDEQILQILKKNAKIGTQKISNITGIPITTVHNRIKKLEKNGIIKNYSIFIDYSKIGKKLSALVLTRLDHKSLRESGLQLKDILKQILKVQGIQRVFTVTGSIDIVLRVRAESIEELDKILTRDLMYLEFISDTETMIITHDVRDTDVI